VAVRGTRGIGLAQMNRTRPAAAVRVAPDGVVTLDDQLVHSDPVESVPLSRLYFL
jgi:urease subunit alpha